jgi:hypothetical protein
MWNKYKKTWNGKRKFFPRKKKSTGSYTPIKTGPRVATLDMNVWFGKHIGKTFKQLIDTAYDYVQWAMAEGIFIFKDDVSCKYETEAWVKYWRNRGENMDFVDD